MKCFTEGPLADTAGRARTGGAILAVALLLAGPLCATAALAAGKQGGTEGGPTIDLTARAENCFTEGDYECAIERASRAVEETTENADAWYWLGRAYYATERQDAALAAFEEALAPGRETRHRGSALYWSGEIHYYAGRNGAAIEFYEQALGYTLAENEWGEALYGLGIARYNLDDNDAALDAFDRYEADGHGLYADYLDYWRALAHRDAGRYERALGHFERFFARPAPDPQAYLHRAWTYIYLGRFDEALADTRTVEGRFDDPVWARSNEVATAFALLGVGEVDKAFAAIRQAEQTDPGYDAFWDLTLLHYATGGLAAAESAYLDAMGGDGYLGIDTQAQPANGHTRFEIVAVFEGTAAEHAGLRVGDLILAMDGAPIPDDAAYVRRIREAGAGGTVRYRILRGDAEIEIAVVLGRFEMDEAHLAESPQIGATLERRARLDEANALVAQGRARDALKALLILGERRPFYRDEIAAITEIARGLDPAPAIPEEARRHAIRAQTLFERVASEADYAKVFEEFELALRFAPWWADAYYNYALAREAAGDPAGAIESFGLFLLAEPDTPTAHAVRDKIYALEILAEEVAWTNRWAGTWQAGTTFESTVAGDVVTMRYLEPSEGSGFRAGETDWWGRLEGEQVKGTAFFHTDNPDVIRCFGNPFEEEMIATLSADGDTITVDYISSSFTISTCETTTSEWKTWTYERIGP